MDTFFEPVITQIFPKMYGLAYKSHTSHTEREEKVCLLKNSKFKHKFKYVSAACQYRLLTLPVLASYGSAPALQTRYLKLKI